MTIHFICRGNAFRSIIAEAYLNSKKLKSVKVLSSGTVADEHREANCHNYPKTMQILKDHGIDHYAKQHYADQLTQERLAGNDVVVCLNDIAYSESLSKFIMPENTLVWNVTDIGEPGRVPRDESERRAFAEMACQEVVSSVDELMSELKIHE